jgi:hypothetical protein
MMLTYSVILLLGCVKINVKNNAFEITIGGLCESMNARSYGFSPNF